MTHSFPTRRSSDLAEQRRRYARLPRGHPVEVAAKRVDLAVMRHHPVGMSELPRREGVGGEALMHERECRGEKRMLQITVIGAELVSEERSEEHTSELQSLMRISYAVFCLKK